MLNSYPTYAQPWNVTEIKFSNDDSPAMIDIKYNGYKEATYEIDPTGVDSKFALTLKSGSDEYVISGSSGGTQDAVAGTVGELVAKINALSEDVEGTHWGWFARRRDALASDSLDHDAFNTVSETGAIFDWTPLVQLNMDTAEGVLSVARLCNPDYDNMDPMHFGNMQQSIGLIGLGYFKFNLTYASGQPELVVKDDDGNDIWREDAESTTDDKESPTSLCSMANPLIVRGPIVVGIAREASEDIDAITTATIRWKPWNL